MNTKFGITQDSVTGPILFCIFINDLFKCSNILKFVMYADDMCVHYSRADVSGNIGVMNRELMRVSNWMTSNGLTLNLNICHYLLLRRKRRVLLELLDYIHIREENLIDCQYLIYPIVMLSHLCVWSKTYMTSVKVAQKKILKAPNRFKNNIIEPVALKFGTEVEKVILRLFHLWDFLYDA